MCSSASVLLGMFVSVSPLACVNALLAYFIYGALLS